MKALSSLKLLIIIIGVKKLAINNKSYVIAYFHFLIFIKLMDIEILFTKIINIFAIIISIHYQ